MRLNILEIVLGYARYEMQKIHGLCGTGESKI
jgi:hypothetical protein